jgi:hypothetical protein
MASDEHDHEPNGLTPLWVRLVYRYGVPAAIALFLTYTITSSVASDVTAMRQEHLELRFYLRGICLNTAQSESQRSACVPPNEAPR